MDKENKEDLNEQEVQPEEEQSTSEETTENVGEDVQSASDEGAEPNGEQPSQEEAQDEDIEAMLSDGTSKRKQVNIPFDKFQEKNEKAKLYDSFAPLLAKLNKNPDMVDELMKGSKTETLEQRLARIEEATLSKQRNEMKQVITEAVKLWPDFKTKWSEIQPIVNGLEKQGWNYREAVQRAYFAVNPEATAEEKRLVEYQQAAEAQNRQGTFSSSSGQSKQVHSSTKYNMTTEDRMVAEKMGIDPKLYEKHAEYLTTLDY